MFCPSCGIEYSIELRYCNRCGANLGSPVPAEPVATTIDVTKSIATIGTTMAVLTLGGFVALIVGAVKLAANSVPTDPIIAMVFMGMLTLLISDIFLARQLSRLISGSLLSGSKKPKLQQPPAVPTATTAQLRQPQPAQLQGRPSVTENTTRFFEPYSPPTEVAEPIVDEKVKR